MIVSTTPTLEGKRITAYLGLVTGEAIMGANVVRDFLAGITDIVGGRSAEYEQELAVARRFAVTEMTERAATIGRTPWSGSTSTTKRSAPTARCSW